MEGASQNPSLWRLVLGPWRFLGRGSGGTPGGLARPEARAPCSLWILRGWFLVFLISLHFPFMEDLVFSLLEKPDIIGVCADEGVSVEILSVQHPHFSSLLFSSHEIGFPAELTLIVTVSFRAAAGMGSMGLMGHMAMRGGWAGLRDFSTVLALWGRRTEAGPPYRGFSFGFPFADPSEPAGRRWSLPGETPGLLEPAGKAVSRNPGLSEPCPASSPSQPLEAEQRGSRFRGGTGGGGLGA